MVEEVFSGESSAGIDADAHATAAVDGHAPLAFLALGCGVGVSTIYLCQPLLPQMGMSFGVGAASAGLIGVTTQIGYAIGLLSFVPMGDITERRKLIVRMFAGVAAALLVLAFAPTFTMLLIGSAVCGVFASVTHIVLPIAPDLAPAHQRGRAVGVVMTGLLLGVLLARTFSGWVNDLATHVTTRVAGWRIVFVVAAAISAMFVPAIQRYLPLLPPKQTMRYTDAIRSLWAVFRAEPRLRESCLVGALAFGSFSCFWNTLAFVLATHGLGAGVAGSFGLVGAAGALIATSAGRVADRKGPRYILSAGMVGLMVAVMGVYATERYALHTQSSGHFSTVGYLCLLAAMVVVLDVGMQCTQLGNQTRIFALQPEARSRINTIYMFTYFIGGACASALSTLMWEHFGIVGVFALQAAFVLAAVLRHITGIRTPHTPITAGEAPLHG